MMQSILPFTVKYCPITKLALIPFEKKPERIYRGFELQYLNSRETGEGYRIICYRNDNYVDVYDDMSLIFHEEETFNVVENGANKHVQTAFENVFFKREDNCEILGFEFTDIENRKISFYYEEKTNRGSVAMNLPAPVGMGSKDPTFLPLFFMYEFDFMRRKGEVRCKIDEDNIELDSFPFPMSGQPRSFCRYSEQCELLEFANTESNDLKLVDLDQSMKYTENNVLYQFEKENVLHTISIELEQGSIVTSFTPALDMTRDCKGTFLIAPNEKMGYIQGHFDVKVENQESGLVKLCLVPDEGWNPVPTTLTSKLLMNKKSIFCSWLKKYEYRADIDIKNNKIHAQWTNYNNL